KVKVGDKVGVGCVVNSCKKCENCSEDLENYCPNSVYTYNSQDVDGTNTYGGYSNIMVANEHMIVKWPESLPLTGAPLLCAGITTYSAMKYYGVNKPGLKVGVVGLGGLGHVAVRFAKAFGMKVTVISSSSHKKDEALEHFGAHGFLNSRDTVDMEAAAGSLDAIIDTVSATHPMQPLLSLLKTSGKLVMVGLPEK
ncbi:zinc-binding dehydrogenase, partial [Acinetobacter baumannii]